MPSPDSSPPSPTGSTVCPSCGAKLSRLPTVDGDGYLWICDSCDFQRLVRNKPDAQTPEPVSAEGEGPGRFRRLLAENQDRELTDELLNELPPEAREALKSKTAPTEQDTSAGDVPGHVKRTLMDYGFAVDEDARGLRLRSPGGLRRPGTGDLSPTDVVRLASQLGGAPPPPEERRTCPACKAVVPRTAARCSWCDAELPPLNPDE